MAARSRVACGRRRDKPVVSARDLEVDVVIATNRASPYLDEAIASVVAQTHRRWNLILVDDGSPCPDVLQQAVRNVAKAVVVRQPPQGVSAARNRGLREGKAGFVAFLDDDDVWAPERLEAQLDAVVATPGSVGAFSGVWFMDADGARFGAVTASRTASRRFLTGEEDFPRIVSLLVTREVCEALGGFDESYRIGEDNEFILRLLMQGELAAARDPLVGYRRHPDNASADVSLEARVEGLRMLGEQIAEARRRHDVAVVTMLGANRERFRRRAAADAAAALGQALRGSDWARVAAELRWIARHAPGGTLREVARKATGRGLRGDRRGH